MHKPIQIDSSGRDNYTLKCPPYMKSERFTSFEGLVQGLRKLEQLFAEFIKARESELCSGNKEKDPDETHVPIGRRLAEIIRQECPFFSSDLDLGALKTNEIRAIDVVVKLVREKYSLQAQLYEYQHMLSET